MSAHWTLEKIAPHSGRQVIVTGANSVVGYHTAAILAQRGAEVVLACRNEQRGAEAPVHDTADIGSCIIHMCRHTA